MAAPTIQLLIGFEFSDATKAVFRHIADSWIPENFRLDDNLAFHGSRTFMITDKLVIWRVTKTALKAWLYNLPNWSDWTKEWGAYTLHSDGKVGKQGENEQWHEEYHADGTWKTARAYRSGSYRAVQKRIGFTSQDEQVVYEKQGRMKDPATNQPYLDRADPDVSSDTHGRIEVANSRRASVVGEGKINPASSAISLSFPKSIPCVQTPYIIVLPVGNTPIRLISALRAAARGTVVR